MDVTTPIYPLGLSENGKRNAYCIMCTATAAGDFRRNYAVCQHLLKGVEQGTLKEELYSDCGNLIRKSPEMCPAYRMRRHEKEKGVSIYFVERSRDYATDDELAVPFEPTPAAYSLSKAATVSFKGSKSVMTESKKSVIGTLESMSVGGFADAIHAAIEEEVEPKEEVVPEAVTTQMIEAKPGESLIEMARRIAGKR